MRHCRLGRRWLVDFNVGKTQLVSFDWSNNPGAIDVKMSGYVIEERSSFKMGLSFSSKLDCGFYIISIAKTASNTIESLTRSIRFLPAEVPLYLYKFIIQPCNTVVGILLSSLGGYLEM